MGIDLRFTNISTSKLEEKLSAAIGLTQLVPGFSDCDALVEPNELPVWTVCNVSATFSRNDPDIVISEYY